MKAKNELFDNNMPQNTLYAFTLVELLVVIVIIGTLASIALPNFISLSRKAKATDAKAQASAIIKTASATYQEYGMSGLVNMDLDNSCAPLGGPEIGSSNQKKRLFDYDFQLKPNQATLKVVAIGNATDSSSENKKITVLANLTNGTIEKVPQETHKDFGGKEKI